jgi:hypothetical protein
VLKLTTYLPTSAGSENEPSFTFTPVHDFMTWAGKTLLFYCGRECGIWVVIRMYVECLKFGICHFCGGREMQR